MHKASCCCGNLSLDIHAQPLRVSVCHCRQCQKRTGSVFGAQARFPAEAVVITEVAPAAEYVRTGDSGTRIHLHFCAQCGSTVYYRVEDLPDFIMVPVGVMADPAFPAPWVSVYEEFKHPWVALPEPMEHFD